MSCAADRILLLPRAGINCTESLKMTIDRGLSQIWKRAGINCTESSGGIPTSGSVGATPATQRPTQRPLHPDCASFAIVLLSHTSFTHFFHTLLSPVFHFQPCSTVTELIKCNHLCMRYNSLEPADVFSVLFKAATQVLDMPLATMTMRWTQCALCLSAILLGFARQLH